MGSKACNSVLAASCIRAAVVTRGTVPGVVYERANPKWATAITFGRLDVRCSTLTWATATKYSRMSIIGIQFGGNGQARLGVTGYGTAWCSGLIVLACTGHTSKVGASYTNCVTSETKRMKPVKIPTNVTANTKQSGRRGGFWPVTLNNVQHTNA